MIHHVFANKSNLGDWLSALGIQSVLAPMRVAEHFCDKPFVDETLKKLSRTTCEDLILIGGGGLFMDYFIPFWKGFRKIATQTPFCIWGVGYCDLKQEPSRVPDPLLEEIVSKSHFCIVRDELSREILHHCNLLTPVPCPSVCVVENPSRRGYGFLHVSSSTIGADVYEAMEVYSRKFIKRTRRPYITTNHKIPTGSRTALEATVNLYATADIILSSRLHGCIIGLAMGRKVLAVSGDYKIESFMQAAGLSDWVCDINAVDSIPKLLGSLSKQRVPHDFMERARLENRLIAKKVAGLVR